MAKPDCKLVRDLFDYHRNGYLVWRVSRQGGVKSGDLAGCLDSKGYVTIRVKGVNYKAHRLIWLWCYGEWPKEHLDHFDRVRNNNRITNLREAGFVVNSKNRLKPKNNTSGVTGVYWVKAEKKWRASITVNGVYISLGSSRDFAEAVRLRRDGEVEYGFTSPE